ncbi:hypothetical protein E2562_037409, partial [Oryza meyeriana var. granulata]
NEVAYFLESVLPKGTPSKSLPSRTPESELDSESRGSIAAIFDAECNRWLDYGSQRMAGCMLTFRTTIGLVRSINLSQLPNTDF